MPDLSPQPPTRPRSADPPSFSCRRSDAGPGVHLAVAGELDIATAPQLDEALRRAQADAELVLLDLHALEFMDASGVHLLRAARRRAAEGGGRLVLGRLPAAAERLLELTDHDRRDLGLAQPEGAAGVAPTLSLVSDSRVLALAGHVDPAAVCALEQRIAGALGDGQSRLAVDLSAVAVLGASVVGLLCGALRRQTRRGASVAILGAPAHLRRIIELCAIDGVDFDPLLRPPVFSQ